jgi:hypothetical protein
MDDLSKLPAPPKGQTGIAPDQFSHLPPPPKGQQGMTLAQIQSQAPKTPGLLAKAGAAVKDAFKSGVGQIKQGIQQGQSATNPLQAVESGITAGAGIVNTALSPLAPVFSPVNKVTNAVADKISNVPAVQNFATSQAGQNVARGAEDIGNLATIAGVGAGAVGGEAVAPRVAGVGKTAIETAVGSAKGALETRKVTAGLNKAYEAVTPTTRELTPTEYQDLLSQRKITPKTTTSPAQYILSDEEKQIAAKHQNLLQGGDPVKNSVNIINEIANQDSQVGNFLRKNNGIYNSGELKNYVLDKMKDVTDVTVDEARIEKLKNTLIDGFIKNLPKNDMETLWKSRKQFDQSIEKVFSGSPTLQKTVKREFRNSIQDFIGDRTPDNTYKSYMKGMRQLFDLQDIVATKATKEKSLNAIHAWVKKNPTKAKVIGGLAGFEVLKKTGLLP